MEEDPPGFGIKYEMGENKTGSGAPLMKGKISLEGAGFPTYGPGYFGILEKNGSKKNKITVGNLYDGLTVRW